ncbi:MAG: hypothetical protein HDR28_01620 [Lachnospiraceae bacterium]|nr:hypothetical protein [Lachnospiraceae bacterium]
MVQGKTINKNVAKSADRSMGKNTDKGLDMHQLNGAEDRIRMRSAPIAP